MSSPQFVTFERVDLKDSDTKVWKERADTLKNTDGARRVFFGPAVEDPAKGVLVVIWTSTPPAQAQGNGGVLTFEFGGSLEAALEAATTEVFTAHGAESAFYDNMIRFAAAIDADPPKKGYFGNAVGKADNGNVVTLLLGWETVEAHTEAKNAPGSSIMANIALVRSGRQSADMIHFKLLEQ